MCQNWPKLDKWAKTPKGDFLNFLLGTKDYDFLYSLVMFLFFLKIDLAHDAFVPLVSWSCSNDVLTFLVGLSCLWCFFPLPINPSWHPTSLPLWFLLLIRRLQCAIISFATCILTLAHCLAFCWTIVMISRSSYVPPLMCS